MNDQCFSENITEVEIFAVGTWNGAKFVESDLAEIAANSNTLLKKEQNKPPVKLGHTKKQILQQEDGQPALGWLSNFNVKAGKLVADLIDVPDLLIQAFKKRLYRQVSVELAHSQHLGWFVKGLAVLGADLPGVKTLKDLNQYFSLQETKEEESTPFVLSFSEPIIERENMSTETINMDSALKAKELEFKQREFELENKLKLMGETLKVHERTAKEMQFKEEKEKVLNPFRQDVKDGKLTPATFEALSVILETQKASFSEEKPLFVPHDFLIKFAQGYKSALPQGEQGEVSDKPKAARADVEIEKKITEIMASSGKDYFEASTLAFAMDPDLETRYHDFGTKISNKGQFV